MRAIAIGALTLLLAVLLGLFTWLMIDSGRDDDDERR